MLNTARQYQKEHIMADKNQKKITRRKAIVATAGLAGIAATEAVAQADQGRSKGKKSLKGKRVLVAIGEFSEGMETYYMIYRMMEEGIEPVVAADSVKRLQMVVHDFDPAYTNYTEKLGYFIETQIAYKDVDPSEYDGLIIPGGRGPEEFRQYKEALDVVGYFMDKKLPLGAMCHGPQALWAARSVKGRKMTCYYGIRADLELAGAKFIDAPVVVDGPMVTSRGWPDLPYMMPKYLEVLAGA